MIVRSLLTVVFLLVSTAILAPFATAQEGEEKLRQLEARLGRAKANRCLMNPRQRRKSTNESSGTPEAASPMPTGSPT